MSRNASLHGRLDEVEAELYTRLLQELQKVVTDGYSRCLRAPSWMNPGRRRDSCVDFDRLVDTVVNLREKLGEPPDVGVLAILDLYRIRYERLRDPYRGDGRALARQFHAMLPPHPPAPARPPAELLHFAAEARHPDASHLRIRQIRLPAALRHACSARALKAALGHVEGCHVTLVAAQERVSVSDHPVVASLSHGHGGDTYLTLYALRRNEYLDLAAREFVEVVLPQLRARLERMRGEAPVSPRRAPQTRVVWAGGEHRFLTKKGR